MNFITAFLFEKPLYLIPVLIVVQFVLIRIWAQRRTVGSKRAVLIGFVVCPLLVLLQAWVVTDREQIVTICEALAVAVEDGDIPAIGEHIAGHFETEGIGKDEFLAHVTRGLTNTHVENAGLSGYTLTFEDRRRPRVRFRASARVFYSGEIAARHLSSWELRFERVSGTWQVVFIKPVECPGFPFNSLWSLLSGVGGL